MDYRIMRIVFVMIGTSYADFPIFGEFLSVNVYCQRKALSLSFAVISSQCHTVNVLFH